RETTPALLDGEFVVAWVDAQEQVALLEPATRYEGRAYFHDRTADLRHDAYLPARNHRAPGLDADVMLRRAHLDHLDEACLARLWCPLGSRLCLHHVDCDTPRNGEDRDRKHQFDQQPETTEKAGRERGIARIVRHWIGHVLTSNSGSGWFIVHPPASARARSMRKK